MENTTKKIMSYTFYLFLCWTIIFVLFKNDAHRIRLLLVFLALIFSSIIRHRYIYRAKKLKNLGRYTLFIDSILICYIMTLDNTGLSQLVFYILIGDVVMSYSTKYSLLYALTNYVAFIIVIYLKLNPNQFGDIYINIMNSLISFIFVYGFVFLARFQMNQREMIQKTSKALEDKTKKLQKAYENLQKSYEIQEELIVLKERNRIAGEIHDTVGHTLTTVLIEIEAGKRLIEKDKILACEKLELAQEQVRKGLNDIRKSVRTIKSGGDVLEFIPSLEALMEETEKHTNVKFHYSFNDIPDLTQHIKKVLYRALQEGITNGIRHGQADEFYVDLGYKDNTVMLNIKDNGHGFSELEEGFGLSNMRYKVEAIGGTLKVKSEEGIGCTLNIEIPLVEV